MRSHDASEPTEAFLRARTLLAASTTGQRVMRFGDHVDVENIPVLRGRRCAAVDGVSLHANVAVPARDRRRLERLCRYVARPPLAAERLSQSVDGRLIYQLKHRWRDGTTHVGFEPLELLEKLAALIPPPRVTSSATTVSWLPPLATAPRWCRRGRPWIRQRTNRGSRRVLEIAAGEKNRPSRLVLATTPGRSSCAASSRLTCSNVRAAAVACVYSPPSLRRKRFAQSWIALACRQELLP